MSENNRFPNTENYAPLAVYVRDTSTNGFQSKPRLALIPIKGKTIKYLRADTATPNDQVVEMMLEAINDATSLCISHMLGYPPAGVAIDGGIEEWEKQKINIVADIRSRHAASDSDNAE